jgi:O-antigen ligase
MGLALFMTASRAGFISLVISGVVCLWHFGVKGRRLYLIVASVLVLIILLVVAGRPLADRLAAMNGKVDTQEEGRAYGSYEERKYLINKAIEGIEHYPILGDLFGCLERGTHDLPANRGRRRHPFTDPLPPVSG